ncbi:hypothetical protein [Methanococcoides sp. NM1]|uniref:hypothetical protein n=1 Tax=Methanococcoides sp. NM1 TaxID=1201013 RepID=UPI00108492B1|nr:hypothetical protein [Methanococcoides sp. NM1]
MVKYWRKRDGFGSTVDNCEDLAVFQIVKDYSGYKSISKNKQFIPILSHCLPNVYNVSICIVSYDKEDDLYEERF